MSGDQTDQDLQRQLFNLEVRYKALQVREGSLRQLLENAHDCILAIDLEGRITFTNPAVQVLSGGRSLIGLQIRKLISPEFRFAYDEMLDRRRAGDIDVFHYEWKMLDAQGRERDFDVRSSILSEYGEPAGTMVIARDVTERKQAEAALRESEAKYRNLVENASEAIFIAQDGALKFVNPRTLELTGATAEELAHTPFTEFIHPEDRQRVMENYLRRLRGESFSHRYRFRVIPKTGPIKWVELSAQRIQWQGRDATLNFVGDITERVATEAALQESEERYRLFFMTSRDAVFITSKDGMLVDCNDAAVELFGFADKEMMKERLRIPDIYADQQERNRHLTDIERLGFTKDYAIDLRKHNGVIIHALVSSVPWRDKDGTVIGFQGTIKDVTGRKATEEQLHRTLDSLRKAFGATVQVLVSAVESRDPYTAGHQNRSADLARAIAQELGLSQERIDGLRMAGIIHDIGKLSVPAEILSRPTQLSDIEFSLIKEHAGKGFEMLKDVESPWPLAEIVYQHHERMDGSGYPRHLKGQEFLMEARILAVADVVESMASHRPYRPALGITAALEEIERHKGTLYDADAVEACLRLFREKSFQLAGSKF